MGTTFIKRTPILPSSYLALLVMGSSPAPPPPPPPPPAPSADDADIAVSLSIRTPERATTRRSQWSSRGRGWRQTGLQNSIYFDLSPGPQKLSAASPSFPLLSQLLFSCFTLTRVKHLKIRHFSGAKISKKSLTSALRDTNTLWVSSARASRLP